ncbi:phage virion morphogenesis protein [Acinetobacter sp. ANC 5502]
MTVIQINDQNLITRLNKVARAMRDPTRLGHAIANSLLTVVEDNFDSEGRPAWAGLRPVTLARRINMGKVLEQSGQLRRSISTHVAKDSVEIGTNDPKAPTHQFGARQGQYGKSSRNTSLPWGTIPARPFLPMDKNGNLQPEAEQALFDDVDHFYKSIFD